MLLPLGCGSDGDSGMGNDPGGGTPVTVEQLTDFYGTRAPQVRQGLQDGVQRLLAATQGGGLDGFTAIPAGGNSYQVSIDFDLDGDGSHRGALDSRMPMLVALQGNPADGIQGADLPATVEIQETQTPYGTTPRP
jgi:hypothetical protein